MSYLSPAEAEAEYQVFLTALSEQRPVWALRNDDGWATWAVEEDEPRIVPFWSTRERAQSGAAVFAGYEPEQVSAQEFLADWLPALRDRGLFIGVNLNAAMAGLDVAPDELLRELGDHGD
ncbi:MAG: DUF2750 domain-containing protein [Planctomycetota bacterium]|nr:DUF2750 domain-containing protein [Planctomycetota bacterium]